MKKTILLAALMSLIAVLAACGREQLPPASVSPSPVTTREAAGPEKEWDSLVKAARKEASLNIYAADVPAAARNTVQQAFKQKYGIDTEYTPGRASEIVQKFKSEVAAGLYLPDIMQAGPTTFFNSIKPLNATVPMDPLLLLPGVVDPSKWRGGKLPFVDADKHGFAALLVAANHYLINTDLVKEDEIAGVADLLNPKWKAQIALQDPSTAGAGQEWFANTLSNVLGMERGEQFMRDLVKQEPMVTRDIRQLAEWVARGKYKVGLGISTSMGVEFINAGAPVAFASVKQPRPLTPGASVIWTFKNVPHPNARKLFLNWFLSQEGNSVYAPAHGYPPARVDVPTEGFIAAVIPRPGDIMTSTEEFESKKGALMKLAAGIFKDSLK